MLLSPHGALATCLRAHRSLHAPPRRLGEVGPRSHSRAPVRQDRLPHAGPIGRSFHSAPQDRRRRCSQRLAESSEPLVAARAVARHPNRQRRMRSIDRCPTAPWRRQRGGFVCACVAEARPAKHRLARMARRRPIVRPLPHPALALLVLAASTLLPLPLAASENIGNRGLRELQDGHHGLRESPSLCTSLVSAISPAKSCVVAAGQGGCAHVARSKPGHKIHGAPPSPPLTRTPCRIGTCFPLVHLAVAVIIFQLGGLVRNVSSARLPWLVFTVTPRGLIRIVRSLGLSRQPAWGEIRSSLAEISFHHPPGACSLLNHRITGARDALPPLDIIDVVILATVGDALNTRVSLPQHVGATFAGHVLFQICQHASAFYLREVHDHRPPRCPS
eukprot:scaffold114828_cov27-Tisochrysis_lutea.AAC.3